MSDLFIDLLITGGDIVLNAGNEPMTCNNRYSIGQDLVHSVMESGLATALIAERSPTLRSDIFTQIILLVEGDERIVPGTVEVEEESLIRLLITGDTYDFGPLSEGVDYGKAEG
ncbi:Protein of uncharacterised function (DUF2590) [Cedecea davisae]|uniref:Phage protein n=1 Tax=Cedecea davisae DSM 4568 TaxID=566551 RepID=S3J4I8_9ENTR|nr:DUF2590 family protein [Cedecea davisae]EPF14922.1 hypothetical protein HMPREF0201_03589 [Cedecea davisae DSM 4568]SUX38077.1 Protein of uncharacterised function (DUF2590) [Cedecea davisae]